MTETIGPPAFDPLEGPLKLHKFPNGGWIITQGSTYMRMCPKELGAYSSAQEMIAALSCIVTDPAEDVKPGDVIWQE